MHMFNLCMLCFFLLCINAYLHLFLLVFMIASCVYNIIAFRLLGCILVDFCSPCMIACGDKNVGCALVHQRRSTSAKSLVERRWSCAGVDQRRPPAPIAQVCAAGLALVATPVVQGSSQNWLVRWSSVGPPAHSAFFWRVFKTTSLHLWPLYIC